MAVLLHNHRHFAKANQYLARFTWSANDLMDALQEESNQTFFRPRRWCSTRTLEGTPSKLC